MENKEIRNKNILALRERGQSFAAIAKKYRVNKVTIFEIYHREKARMGATKNKTIRRKYPNI